MNPVTPADWSAFFTAAAGALGALAGLVFVALSINLTRILSLPGSAGLTARRAVLHQFAALPGVLACVALYGGLSGGMSWFAFGVVASILVAMLNSWVLLVEILR